VTTEKVICANAQGCPCQLCGQVRLLFEHELQRYLVAMDPSGIPSPEKLRAVPCAICASAAMRAELIACPLCGAPGLLPEIEALAQKFLDDYLNRQG
jgi:hypothetical protein